MKLFIEKMALAAVALTASATICMAQNAPLPLPEYEILMRDVEAYHSDYDFSSAVQAYSEALRKCRDSLKRAEIEKKLSQSRNGQSMAGFCQRPKVVARKNFSRKDFFLY